MLGDATRAVPFPTPVTFGGRGFSASELRVADFARLQDFMKRRTICPLDAAGPMLAHGQGTPAWERLLAITWERQEAWPPPMASEEAAALLEDAQGLSYFAWTCFRREHPGLTHGDVLALLPDATEEEIGRLRRVAWGTDPIATLLELIDGPPEEEAPGKPLNWVEVKFAYMKEYPGGPPFGELTITDLKAVLAGGKAPEPGSMRGKPQDWTPGMIRTLERREQFWERNGASDDRT